MKIQTCWTLGSQQAQTPAAQLLHCCPPATTSLSALPAPLFFQKENGFICSCFFFNFPFQLLLERIFAFDEKKQISFKKKGKPHRQVIWLINATVTPNTTPFLRQHLFCQQLCNGDGHIHTPIHLQGLRLQTGLTQRRDTLHRGLRCPALCWGQEDIRYQPGHVWTTRLQHRLAPRALSAPSDTGALSVFHTCVIYKTSSRTDTVPQIQLEGCFVETELAITRLTKGWPIGWYHFENTCLIEDHSKQVGISMHKTQEKASRISPTYQQVVFLPPNTQEMTHSVPVVVK